MNLKMFMRIMQEKCISELIYFKYLSKESESKDARMKSKFHKKD